MFGKKKPVKLELKMEEGYYRLIVDYFDAKEKAAVRRAVYGYLRQAYPELLLQADSNFINKQMDGKDAAWMEGIIRWAEVCGLEMDHFKYKREVAAGIFGGIFGGKTVKPGYRVGVILDPDHVDEAVAMHGEIGMGVHLGGGLRAETREMLLKDYCGGRIDDLNFEQYYTVDFYDYDLISRCVLKSLGQEPLAAAKEALEKELSCFNCS